MSGRYIDVSAVLHGSPLAHSLLRWWDTQPGQPCFWGVTTEEQSLSETLEWPAYTPV